MLFDAHLNAGLDRDEPMKNISWLPPILVEASERLARAINLSDLAGSTVWLAVTGLSRSGKTVFTTSLIHNLLSAVHNPNRMPLLNVVGERRLVAATLEAAGAQPLPQFPYRRNIEMMAGNAGWPKPTADISEVGVDIRFTPAGHVGRLVSELSGGASTLTLRIVDYPGEWLLDLPLLGQSYTEWSRATIELWRKAARGEIARDFLAALATHRVDEPASEDTAKQLHDLYRACLATARDRLGLSFLQPGRFLCRGSLPDAPYLWFAPLDIPEGTVLAPHTLGALMAERFDAYKREAVERFYQDHFRHYRRQIVLVDVLRALLAGRDAFDDTRMALDAILDSFRYGHGGLIARLFNGPHIDKVLFAATKADHVPDMQRDHLAALLRNMAALPALDVMSSNARMEVAALASVISTAEDTEEIDGRRVPVVVGRPVGARKQSKFFVGTVPIRPPRADQWDTPFLDVPVFEPPAVDPSPVEGIPHINLDSALEFLLGDRLR
jgi:predicted YcjX-like family ATPase